VVSQRGRVTEPGPLRHLLDREIRLLQQAASEDHPLMGQPVVRAGPDLRPEPPGEGARGHVRPPGQVLDGQLLVQVGQQPFQQRLESVAIRLLRNRCFDELGLAAGPVRRHHHAPGQLRRDLRAVLLAHKVQASVDGRRGTRTGDHSSVLDIERIGYHIGLGKTRGQFLGVAPVGRAAPPVQQAGPAQDEGARADGHDPRSPLRRAAQGFEGGLRCFGV
jgi:hypothetical protein